ncbi:hypothetical protein GCM10022378_08200 [Salinicoccus jeotgali]|uniref:DUF5050 domain-containing protein n=1 Tax=Salinicoccus jeotgali TaxID=381634 RepID=A0ABP7ER81_9STAP
MTAIIIGFILFVAAVTYSMTTDDSPYRHHTGLGESIDISPDDDQVAFSYYDDGRESIYIGDIGGGTEEIALTEEADQTQPQFTPDGQGLMYLSRSEEGIQTLHLLPEIGGDPIQLTSTETHVFEAAMSPDGETVYYIAMPSEDLLAAPESTENGRDLHRVSREGDAHEKLTDKDAFDMRGLNVSADGEMLHFMGEAMRSYDLKTKEEQPYVGIGRPGYIGVPTLSSDGASLAYTAQAGESDKGTYIYELFLTDTETEEVEQLTNQDASVMSPAFFNNEERLAFLVQEDWPSEPAVYEIQTISYEGDDMAPLEVEMPETSGGVDFGTMLDKSINTATLTLLYLLTFGLAIVYAELHGRTLIPVAASALLTVLVIITMFFGLDDPWRTIGMMMLSVWLLGCTGVLLVFALLYRKTKRYRGN